MKALHIGLVTIAAIFLTFFVIVRIRQGSSPELWWSYPNPDGRFRIEVLRFPIAFSPPGGASDAPGLVRLLDIRGNQIIHERQIEMVQPVDAYSVEWSPTNVSIKLLADWSLPK